MITDTLISSSGTNNAERDAPKIGMVSLKTETLDTSLYFRSTDQRVCAKAAAKERYSTHRIEPISPKLIFPPKAMPVAVKAIPPNKNWYPLSAGT